MAVKIESRSEDVLSEKADLTRLLYGDLKPVYRDGILGTNIEISV